MWDPCYSSSTVQQTGPLPGDDVQKHADQAQAFQVTYWYPVTTEDGQSYYCNWETGETAWDVPCGGKVTVGGQDLKDTDPVADFANNPWCIVFTSCRSKLLEAAKAAMESEEYKEATSHLHDLVQQHSDLTDDELQLLSLSLPQAPVLEEVFGATAVSFQNFGRAFMAYNRRNQRRVQNQSFEEVLTCGDMQFSPSYSVDVVAREEGSATTEAVEVEAFCLEERLLPHSRGHERLVYGRLAGDYYRYLTELGGDEAEERKRRGHQAYEAAIAVQEDVLVKNYSVFLHGLGDEDRAIAVARTAFEAFRLHVLRA
ncbi:YWHAB [Symbiodinium necroappetens]|uniref:YWHAB protein n=1 Tax=Symbiodinium necroappetens TaxID=1628268 RepID=A0A812NA57_9DINO|nr:YWHAB [Symbiodinium necroappetens]